MTQDGKELTPVQALCAGSDHYAETLPILSRLQQAGYEAVLVGGGVRDLLLGRPVTDWDIATDALPEKVVTLFPDTVPTGARHGTITVLQNGDPFEVTTYRSDGPYSDGRRPDWVRFGLTLTADLARRDFTINALAFDPLRRQFSDPHGGKEDLKRRVIRAVGVPKQRFREDGLRPLRGIRLAAVLNFTIDPETFQAMQESAAQVAGVAVERVRDELTKLMMSDKPSRGFDCLNRSGLLRVIIPELMEGYGMHQNKYHAHDVFWHTMYTVDAAPADKTFVRWASLLHDIAKPRTRTVVNGEGQFRNHQFVGAEMAKNILERLRMPNREQDAVAHLIREHMFHYTPNWSDSAVRRFIQRVGRENLENLFTLRIADNIGNGLKEPEPPGLLELKERILEITKRDDALSLNALVVDGEDVMRELDLPPGPRVGKILMELLDRVIEDPSLNERESLHSLMHVMSDQ